MSIISVKGPREGEITLHTSPENVMGTFDVGFNTASPSSSLYVLYRLRVKEASILFSKKYSILGGSHTKDEISMYAQPSLVSSEKISTIRVEYTVLSPEDATRLSAANVQLDRATCQPFFAHTGSLTYDVKCIVSGEAPPTLPPSTPTKLAKAPGASAWPVRVVVCTVTVAAAVALGLQLYRSTRLASGQ